MKIFGLSDFRRFCAFVLSCEGRVWYVDENKVNHDMKDMARYALQTEMIMESDDGIEIVIEQPEDGRRMLRYVMNAGHTANYAQDIA